MKHVLAVIIFLTVLTGTFHSVEAAFEADSHSPWECALSAPLLPVVRGLLPGANPALAFEGGEIAVKRSYGLSELVSRSLGIGKDLFGNTCSISASLLGSDLYKESSVGIGLARAYGDRLTVGARLGLLWLSVPGFVSELSPELDLGVEAVPLPQFSIGASVTNVLGSMKDSPGPTSSIGLCLGPAEGRVLAAATQNRSATRTSLGGAMRIGSHLGLMAGISSHPSQLSAGIEISSSTLALAIAVEWHSELGLSESIGLRFMSGLVPSKEGE